MKRIFRKVPTKAPGDFLIPLEALSPLPLQSRDVVKQLPPPFPLKGAEKENPFVGTWKLISFETRRSDGTVMYPFGKDLKGLIMYDASGSLGLVEPSL